MNELNNFDDYVDSYDNILSKDLKFFSKNTNYFAKYKINILFSELNIKNPIKVLEPGCGTGRNLFFLKKYFPNAEIVGTDISKKSVEYVKKNLKNIKCYSEDDIDVELTDFDLIFVAGVYHHLDSSSWNKFTELCMQRLKNNGNLVIFEHNPFNPITRLIVSRCPFDNGVKLIKMKTLINHFEENNLTLQERGYCLIFPYFMRFLQKFEFLFKYVPLGGQYYIHLTK